MADLDLRPGRPGPIPPMLLRAAYHGLAAAHAVLGHDDQAAEAMRKSGLGAAPAANCNPLVENPCAPRTSPRYWICQSAIGNYRSTITHT